LEGIKTLSSSSGEQITKKARAVVKSVCLDKSKGEEIRHAAMTTQSKRKGDYSILICIYLFGANLKLAKIG